MRIYRREGFRRLRIGLGSLVSSLVACLLTTFLVACSFRDPCSGSSLSDECLSSLGPGFVEAKRLMGERDRLCAVALKNDINGCGQTADSTPECLRAEKAGRRKMADKDCQERLVSSTVCYVTFNCMLYEQYKEAGDRDQEEYYWRSCLKALREEDPVCKEADEQVQEQMTQLQKEIDQEKR